jgi:hypothetical protein
MLCLCFVNQRGCTHIVFDILGSIERRKPYRKEEKNNNCVLQSCKTLFLVRLRLIINRSDRQEELACDLCDYATLIQRSLSDHIRRTHLDMKRILVTKVKQKTISAIYVTMLRITDLNLINT